MTARLLSLEEAAERLGVTERWMRRARFERRIGVVKLGHLVRVPEDELERLIASGTEPALESTKPGGNRA